MSSFLFVCTGNICRSPLAELIMRREAQRRGLELDIDSAATGSWNLGEPPDRRACAVARRNGLETAHLRARLVKKEDFQRFRHIIALDRSHLKALRRLQPPGSQAEISLLMDHLPGHEGREVADPYYGPDEGFDTAWREIDAACRAMAETLLGPVK